MNLQEQLIADAERWRGRLWINLPDILEAAANRIKQLEEAIEILEVNGNLMDDELYPPDANCSCHICPPCDDCQNWSGQRIAKEGWLDAKAMARKIMGQA